MRRRWEILGPGDEPGDSRSELLANSNSSLILEAYPAIEPRLWHPDRGRWAGWSALWDIDKALHREQEVYLERSHVQERRLCYYCGPDIVTSTLR